MAEYEVTFVTGPLSDEQEDVLESRLDASVGGHGEVTLVTASAKAPDGTAAAKRIAAEIRDAGVPVHRVHPDLVNIGQIAKRAGVTRQAASHWANGRRKTGFPAPHVLAGGNLWRWQEVNEWLAEAGHPHDEVRYLTAQDETVVDYWLYVHRNASAWRKSEVSVVQMPHAAIPPGVSRTRVKTAPVAKNAKRSAFVLA